MFWINFFNVFRLFWFINIKKRKKKEKHCFKTGKQEGRTPYAASKKFGYVFYMFLFFMETKLFSNVFPLFLNKNLCFCAHREQPSSAGSATVNPDWYGFQVLLRKTFSLFVWMHGGLTWFACPSHSSVFYRYEDLNLSFKILIHERNLSFFFHVTFSLTRSSLSLEYIFFRKVCLLFPFWLVCIAHPS